MYRIVKQQSFHKIIREVNYNSINRVPCPLVLTLLLLVVLEDFLAWRAKVPVLVICPVRTTNDLQTGLDISIVQMKEQFCQNPHSQELFPCLWIWVSLVHLSCFATFLWLLEAKNLDSYPTILLHHKSPTILLCAK